MLFFGLGLYYKHADTLVITEDSEQRTYYLSCDVCSSVTELEKIE